MSEMILANVPSMSAGDVINKLSYAYSTLINKGLPVTTMPSVMLWGPPGVGKSQAVRAVAKKIEQETGKKTNVRDVRLLLFNPVDLRGIPTKSGEKKLAVWLKPEIFQMDEGKNVVNILFLDEISAAPQSVQAAAYQITLDRRVGEHSLPDNCIVIAAGNRTTDRSVAYKMPKALANRLMHFEVESNFKSWKKWATENGINEKVVGFLSFKEEYLMGFNVVAEDLAFATPRSWEMVSDVLNKIDDDIDNMFSFIAGLVGSGMAMEFKTWVKIYSKLPSMKDIFGGKNVKAPEDIDALYALTSSMVAYARANKDDMDAIANSLAFASKMKPEFACMIVQDYENIEEDYVLELMKISEFKLLTKKLGLLMDR